MHLCRSGKQVLLAPRGEEVPERIRREVPVKGCFFTCFFQFPRQLCK